MGIINQLITGGHHLVDGKGLKRTVEEGHLAMKIHVVLVPFEDDAALHAQHGRIWT